MKKLLSILAGLAMTATTATTVVSCSWGCSSDKSAKADNVTLDQDGNVSATFEVAPTQDIDAKDINNAFAVYGPDGKKIDGAQIEVVPENTPTPLKAGQTYKFKVKYTLKNPYDGTTDQKCTVKEIDVKGQNTDPSKTEDYNPDYGKELKGGASATIDLPKNGVLSPDYGNIGSGQVTMNKPTWESNDVPDGNGYFKGTTKDGKTVSVDTNSHLVDVTSSKTDPNSGFGKRIAGLDANGKPLKDDAPDGDGQNIYLDNDGYRIKYYDDASAKAAGVTVGWHRVSNNGKNALGPDTGDKAWEINDEKGSDGKGTNAVDPKYAPYKSTDKDGKITYLDKDGYPVDVSGMSPEAAAAAGTPDKANPNYGKRISGASQETSANKYAGTDGTGSHKDSADQVIKKEKSNDWTLSGDAQIKLGSKAKDGSVIIGDGGADGLKSDPKTAVALNPSDPSSHQWTTIPSGKYAGMQVKISDDGNSVSFKWPVKDKQIDDIISGSDKVTGKDDKNSPLDENGKINLPIEYTDGKDGQGNKIDEQHVNITTPWDADAKGNAGDADAAMSWWVDSTMVKQAIKYDAEQTSVNVYLSSQLVDAMKTKKNFLNSGEPLFGLNMPDFDADYLDVSIDGMTDDTNADNFLDSVIKNKDGVNYIQFNIKAKTGLPFVETKDLSVDFSSKDTPFIKGAHAAVGTYSSVNVSLTAISKNISFNSTEEKTDDNNNVEFTVDQSKLPTDIDFSHDPTVMIKKQGSSDAAVDIKQSGLLATNGGFNWDSANYKIKLVFADGKLDKSKYELTTKFDVKKDRTEDPFGPVENNLIVDKESASTNEKDIAIASENASVSFNGNLAEWTGFTKKPGSLINNDTPDIVVSHAKDKFSLVDDSITAQSIKWDGEKLSFKLSDSMPEGSYSVSVTFGLNNGFGSVKMQQTLNVSVNDGHTIDWKQGQLDSLTFARNEYVAFDIASKDKSWFKSDSVDKNNSTIEYRGSYALSENKDWSWDIVDGQVKITLNKEIPYQEQKLKFIVTLVDTQGHSLTPQEVDIAKNEAMASHSEINWTSAKEQFNDTTVKFEVKDKTKLEDIDFSSLDKSAISLIAKDTNAGTYELPKDYYEIPDFDGNTLTIKLKLPDGVADIKRGNYDFTTKFALTNGYEKSDVNTTEATITAAKDMPLERNSSVKMELVGGADKNILDNGVEYKILGDAGSVGAAINLNDTAAISVKFENPDYAGKVAYSYDKDSQIISVNMAKGQEISGGQSKIQISFGFKDFDDYGYKAGINPDGTPMSVVGYTGTVIKKEPTPGYTEVKLTSDAEFKMASNVKKASFTFDPKNPKGVDIDLKNLVQVEQYTGADDSKAEVVKATDGKGTFADGTSFEYDAETGQLNVLFTDNQIHTTELYTTPRKFKAFFAVGNGYEKSDFAAKNPNGFASDELTVQKSEASSYEKELKATDATSARDFYETEKGGDWNLTSQSDSIDWNAADIKITWTKNEKDIPWDSNKGIVFKPNTDEDADPEIDPDKSTRKNPNNYIQETVTDSGNGVKKFHLAFENGSLWQDTYTVQLRFKLKDYKDEYSDAVTLHFTKQKPNAEELKVTAKGTKYEVTDYSAGSGAAWSGRHLQIKITFTDFGGCIDPVTKPSINIWGVGYTELSDQGWGIKGKLAWSFVKRGKNSDGSVWFEFKTTNLGNVGSYYWSTHHHTIDAKHITGWDKPGFRYDSKLEVSFLSAGFSGDSAYTPVITLHSPDSPD